MEIEFIPHEQAKILAEFGLEGTSSILQFYKDENEELFDMRTDNDAPCILYQQAFRFFREKYNMMIIISPYDFTAEIDFLDKRIKNERMDFIPHEHLLDKDGESMKYLTYEEAELACLKKLIEIIKNKKQ